MSGEDIHVRTEPPNTACSACGEKHARGAVAVVINETTTVFCPECGDHTATSIQNKLSLLGSSVLPRDEMTAELTVAFATWPAERLLDELVDCTVGWHVGPIDADKRHIATVLLERLATLVIARKRHRAGCEIWSKYRLCNCPWEVLS